MRTLSAAGPLLLLLALATVWLLPAPTQAGTFEEYFTSKQYCDVANTTAEWDTTAFGEIRLHPFAVAVRGSCDTPGHARGLELSGNYAYVADYLEGLQVIDISDPDSPYIAASFDTPGSANNLAVDGDYVYVADGSNGVEVFDISDPTAPTSAGGFSTFSWATSVAISGDRAYVSDGVLGLAVYDISDPTSVGYLGRANSVNYANHVVVEGNYAYVADDDAGLQVFNISNPASPQLVGGCPTPGPAIYVAVTGDFAYVACGGSGLQIVDVSDPTNPSAGVNYPTSGSTAWVALMGEVLYTCDYTAGIRSFYVDGGGGIGPIGEYDMQGTSYGIALAGDFACVTSVNHGFKVISIADRITPYHIGTGEARTFLDMEVSGHYAFCACSDRIDIISLVDLDEAEFVGTYALNLPSAAVDLCISGDHLYAAIYDSLLVLDISDPTGPERAGVCNVELGTSSVEIAGDYAFVTGGMALSAVNISDPTNPAVAGACTTGYATMGIDISGNYAYVGSEHHGLIVIDISDPTGPSPVTSVDTLGWCMDVVVDGDHAFVANYYDGLHVIDISDPTSPVTLWTGGPGSYSRRLAVTGDYAFVASQSGYGLYIVDISNPASPVTLDAHGPGLEVSSLALFGDHILLGEEDGFRAVEIFQRMYDTSRNMVYSLPIAPGEAASRVRISDSRSYICLWEVSADSAEHWQYVYEDSGWTDLDYPGENLCWRATLIYEGRRQNPGAGMLRIEYEDVAGVDSAAERPEFMLSPCSPNPFAAETRLKFTLPERMDVTLTVHDVTGRRVAVLTEGPADAGKHSIRWAGTSAAGKRVSPGIYFARIEAGHFEAATKVVVLE